MRTQSVTAGSAKRLACLATLLLAGASAATVKVESGLLAGHAEDGLTVYRGIPFAASPEGEAFGRQGRTQGGIQ